MKFVLKITVTTIAIAFLASAAFCLSPLSRRTASLRVELSVEGKGGHRATLVNDGYLPVVVGRCDTLSDAEESDAKVGDAIQRWDTQSRTWVTTYQRSACKVVPTGISRASFSYKLLWHAGRLHTSPFFHWTGDREILTGDAIRFILFTGGPESDSPSLTSQPFIVE
jgi:hypothetical protein